MKKQIRIFTWWSAYQALMFMIIFFCRRIVRQKYNCRKTSLHILYFFHDDKHMCFTVILKICFISHFFFSVCKKKHTNLFFTHSHQFCIRCGFKLRIISKAFLWNTHNFCNNVRITSGFDYIFFSIIIQRNL